VKYYNLAELRDSRLLYDKNPPRFMFVVIGITLLLVTAAIAASVFLHKPYVVKAQGLVSSEQKAELTANVSGTITANNLKEGAVVKAGDTILSFDDTQTETQVKQAQDLVASYAAQVKLYDRCINDIQQGENSFKKSDSSQLPFYNAIVLAQSKMAQYDIPDSQYKSAGYTDDQIKAQQAQNAQQKASAKYQAISDLETQRSQLLLEEQNAQSQCAEYQRLIKSYSLQAPQSGVVHLSIPLSAGMTLQAGTAIGTISGDSSGGIELDAYIQAQDRPMVKVGDSVQIAVSGVSQSDYGLLSGKIINIDTDATVDQDKGTVSYKTVIKPNSTELKDKHGDTIQLKSGMVAEARVQYKDTTWFNWVLEQIGLKTA
jgi:multidrug resistance efflux pump